MVLAGACCPNGSCDARTRPESRSATSHACAGPSGRATAPAGWTPGSADAVGAATAEPVTASAVAKAANIFRTNAESNLRKHRFEPRAGLGSVADQQLLTTFVQRRSL